MKRHAYETTYGMTVKTKQTGWSPSRLLRDFCRCGITGWCLEVMFTSADSLLAGDFRLMGQTSLLMFPIYGMGALLPGIGYALDWWLTGLPGFPQADAGCLSGTARMVRHGLVYMVLIFTAEYLTGTALTALGICPWDYSSCPDQIQGVIRLRFAPLWFITGLILEGVTKQLPFRTG